jgi:hypothetical protein
MAMLFWRGSCGEQGRSNFRPADENHSLGDVKRASDRRPLSPRTMSYFLAFVAFFVAFFAMLASYSRNRLLVDLFRADNSD